MGNRGERPPRLMRIKPKRMLGGICAGFAYWLGWPTWLVRVLAIFTGVSILAYIILWIFMPATDEVPSDYDERTR